MEITLQKESVSREEISAGRQGEVMTESDVIVPDTKPDMGKILTTVGRARVTDCTKQGDRLLVAGIADYTVLYVPEKEEDGLLESLEIELPFKDVFTGFGEEGADVDAEAEITSASATLLNSRKLAVKGTVSLQLTVGRKRETVLTVGLSADKVPAIRTETVPLTTLAARGRFTSSCGQRMEVPEELPPINTILSTDASVYEEDVKLITGKLILKGTVRLETLFRAPDGMPHLMEHAIPYTEILDIPAAEEGMHVSTDYVITEIFCEKDDDDERERSFGAEVAMEIRAELRQETAVEYLTDFYVPGENIRYKSEPVTLETAVYMPKERLSLRETVSLTEDMPPIARVIKLSAVPHITGVTLEGGEAHIEGMAHTDLLYLTEGGTPYLFSDRFPFALSIPTKAPENAAISCMARLENASYTLPDTESADIRLILEIGLRLTESRTVQSITEIEETEKNTDRPSLVISFANGKDSLWEIGKRYSTSAEKIGEVNGLDAEAVPAAGTRLLIP